MPSSIAKVWMSGAAETPWLPGNHGASWRDELEPSKHSITRKPRIGFALLAATLLAAAAAYAIPRAIEAVSSLDDPARIAGRALDDTFDAAVAQREIEAALSAQDAELAQSFVDLSAARHVTIDPELVEKVAAATAEAATARHRAKSFARGFVNGEPQDMASLAGTTASDLFIFGDIRDALREGTKYVRGEKPDELMLGLATAGIAITAGTYATFGAAAPARVGLTLAKVARKTGSLSAEFAVARDVGRVEKAAGGRAALDGLKIVKEPRDITRIAKLAEKEGSRTRAILKVAGRGAIALAAFAFDASLWLLGAAFAVFGFVASLKSTVERATLRILRRRREMRKAKQPIAAALAHG